MLQVMIDMLAARGKRVRLWTSEIAGGRKDDPVARRLMTIPGIGPITATAIVALAPAAETFEAGETLPPGSG